MFTKKLFSRIISLKVGEISIQMSKMKYYFVIIFETESKPQSIFSLLGVKKNLR